MEEREGKTEIEAENTEKDCGVGRYASMCLASQLGISIYL